MYNPEDILYSVSRLPTLPTTVHKVFGLCRDPFASAQDVVEVVGLDQGITANVLKICNSAYYSFSREISSLINAVALLGNKTVFEIILASCTRSYYASAVECYGLSRGDLWHHCMAAAITSRVLSKRIKYADSQSLFTAALLHDLGKTVINQFLTGNRGLIIEKVQRMGCSILEAEKIVLGCDHPEVGARIAAKWNFPEKLVHAIQKHHSYSTWSRENELPRFVYLSNNLSHLLDDSYGCDGITLTQMKLLLQNVGIPPEQFNQVVEEINDEIEKSQDMMII